MMVTIPKEITAREAAELERIALEEKAWRSFMDFLPFVKIQEAPTPQDPRPPVVPMQMWPHVIELALAVTSFLKVVVLKARQVGVSWLLAAYALWYAQTHTGAVVFIFSKGQREARVFLERCKTVRRYLPPGLQVGIVGIKKEGQLDQVVFANGSKIVAFPSTPDAGRSEQASIVIQDEGEFHEFLDSNYLAVKPTIDMGGQHIIVSTANKRKAVTVFKEQYRGAPENGYRKMFIGYTARPGRDEQWYERAMREIPRAESLSPEEFMEQEYPRNEDEALRPSSVLVAFATAALNDMRQYCRVAISDKPEGVPSMASVYEKWMPGRRYVAFTDTSHGVGVDYGVTVVMDCESAHVVADIMDRFISPPDLAYQSTELLHYYKDPLWGIEDNDWGIQTISEAEHLGYRKLYMEQGRKMKGWHTDDRNRPVMWGELMQAIDGRLIIIPNEEGLGQFYDVIKNPEKAGRIEAGAGANDDYPFAVAGAWQLRKEAYAVTKQPVFVSGSW